eukprot:2056174-Amphidinium_carterae.1
MWHPLRQPPDALMRTPQRGSGGDDPSEKSKPALDKHGVGHKESQAPSTFPESKKKCHTHDAICTMCGDWPESQRLKVVNCP